MPDSQVKPEMPFSLKLHQVFISFQRHLKVSTALAGLACLCLHFASQGISYEVEVTLNRQF
jgi:hypothetical protein